MLTEFVNHIDGKDYPISFKKHKDMELYNNVVRIIDEKFDSSKYIKEFNPKLVFGETVVHPDIVIRFQDTKEIALIIETGNLDFYCIAAAQEKHALYLAGIKDYWVIDDHKSVEMFRIPDFNYRDLLPIDFRDYNFSYDGLDMFPDVFDDSKRHQMIYDYMEETDSPLCDNTIKIRMVDFYGGADKIYSR